ncbi:MAG: signal peptide peptidase SppA, partial [Desulfovibrionaceae bacterium]|nr:signal peptide peptidase SppA [Desulfovibrionaceae bacterium]
AFAAFQGADTEDGPLAGERLALVSVRGSIMDVQPLLDWIRKIEREDNVRGVLLRIDSPGGGAAASQELYAALARLAGKKPVVASMGSVAASGGLMVAMAGQKVFANASTVTGSIGVRMDIPQLQGLLGKLGLGQETLVTAPYKDAGSYLRPLSAADRAYFEHVLKDMHEQFVDIVARGRNLPREKALALADGKIFTGREALHLGLVDTLGGQDEALACLANLTGVPADRPLLKRLNKKSWLEKSLEASLQAALAALLGRGAGEAAMGQPELTDPLFLYRF